MTYGDQPMSYLSVVFLTFALSVIGLGVLVEIVQACFPYRACYPNTLHGQASMIIRRALCLD